MHFTRDQINDLGKIKKINLINSCSGYKSANLIGTISKEGITNVAVFSSVTHLGSNPPTLGFILRPTTVPRDTYKNIIDTKEFTVNHINVNDIDELNAVKKLHTVFNSNERVNSDEIFDHDQFYLMNIWASWCIPCRDEHNFLMKLKKNEKIEMIGLLLITQ